MTAIKQVTGEAEGLYKEKGSKFISYAYPVSSLDDVQIHLQSTAELHPSARHICYAYAIGLDREVRRMNDAGEPSGTAGKPIYGQIRSHNLTNTLIVVVRYFGGTKLGVGGLISAYKAAANDAILNANLEEYTEYQTFIISGSHNETGALQTILNKYRIEVIEDRYTTDGFNFKLKSTKQDYTEIASIIGNLGSLQISACD